MSSFIAGLIVGACLVGMAWDEWWFEWTLKHNSSIGSEAGGDEE